MPRTLLTGSLLAASLAGALAGSADARVVRRAVRPVPKPAAIAWLRCYAGPVSCDRRHPTDVFRSGALLVGASGLTHSSRVLFAVRTSRGTGSRAVGGLLLRSTRLLVTVPADAVSGPVRVLGPGQLRSSARRLTVRRPPAAAKRPTIPTARPTSAPASSAALQGTGMWIWYLNASSGGSIPAIGQAARTAGIRTVFMKSGDGTSVWSQFSAANVAALKAEGLHVCGWQYVYGTSPVAEAQVSAAAAQAGADCLVIDAEGEYEGKYAQAQQYLAGLRSAVGASYPLGLASFPYVDYHPAFPFSVFLGPGGAQFNLPQMYWKDIGTTPDAVYAHTWPLNRVYGAPIFPLGQLYQSPTAADVTRFRQLAVDYGSPGLSWWDWQEASPDAFTTVGAPLAPTGDPAPPASTAWPSLAAKAKGDLVVWAQEHLNGAGAALTVDGDYGALTQSAVQRFQQARGLPVTGTVDAATWPVLLAVPPQIPDWSAGTPAATGSVGGTATGPGTGSGGTSGSGSGGTTGSSSGSGGIARARDGSPAARWPGATGPASATLRPLHNEIRPTGRG